LQLTLVPALHLTASFLGQPW